MTYFIEEKINKIDNFEKGKSIYIFHYFNCINLWLAHILTFMFFVPELPPIGVGPLLPTLGAI